MGKKMKGLKKKARPKRQRPPREDLQERKVRKRPPIQRESDFAEPDDTVYHQPTTTFQDFSQVQVEEPREAPTADTDEIIRRIDTKIGQKIEEALQTYIDRYFYAELDRRFKELMECINRQETAAVATPSGADWSSLEEIKNRLSKIEETQQLLLQHQMEMELEMVCNKCGRTIPEDSETCTFCSGEEPDDFVVDEKDYARKRTGEEFGSEDLADYVKFERIPKQQDNYYRDDGYYDRGGGGWDEYDRGRRDSYDSSASGYTGVSDNYDPSPKQGWEEPQQQQGPPPTCPNCYKPLEYVDQYDAFFCRTCVGYLDMSNGKLVKVGPSKEKKRSSKRFKDSGQKLEDVVSYIEYDPDKEPRKGAGAGKGKKKGGLFKFGKK
jgi:hypothetical protein